MFLTNINTYLQLCEVFNFQDVQHFHVKYDTELVPKEVYVENQVLWAEGQKGSWVP
jgi:hypothetical protein